MPEIRVSKGNKEYNFPMIKSRFNAATFEGKVEDA